MVPPLRSSASACARENQTARFGTPAPMDDRCARFVEWTMDARCATESGLFDFPMIGFPRPRQASPQASRGRVKWGALGRPNGANARTIRASSGTRVLDRRPENEQTVALATVQKWGRRTAVRARPIKRTATTTRPDGSHRRCVRSAPPAGSHERVGCSRRRCGGRRRRHHSETS